jgi:GNAT superfamily N-acetyltransferase
VTAPLADLGGGVVLRRAAAADLPAIVALLADDPLGATREGADPAPYEAAFAAVDADPAHLLVVADDDGAAVGTLQLSFLPGLSRGGALRAQVEGVRVAASGRGRGLGEAMLRWCADEARRRGAVLVQLTTDSRRPDAHRFYERLGFVASHVGMKLEL